jgi:hypothetical protein
MILVPGSVKGKGGGEVFVSKPTRLMDGQFVFARPRTRDRSQVSTHRTSRQISEQLPLPAIIGGPARPHPPSNYGWVSERKEPRREYLQPGHQCTPATIQNQPSARGEELRLAFSSLLYLPHPHSHSQPHTPHHNSSLCISASSPSSACTTFFFISLSSSAATLPAPREGKPTQESPSRSRPPSLLIIASDLVRILFLPPCSSFPCWYLCSDVNYGYHSH